MAQNTGPSASSASCLPSSPLEALRLVGDPVDVVTGAVTDRMRDFRVDGPAPVDWWRYYDSRRCHEDRGVGAGHRHGFDHRLLVDLDGLTYEHPDGTDATFLYAALDEGVARDQGYTLEVRSQETYVVRRHAEPTLEFHLRPGAPEAQLVAVRHRDAAGAAHTLTFRHDRRGRLSELLVPGAGVVILDWGPDGHLARASLHRKGQTPAPLIDYEYHGHLLTAGIDGYDQRFSFGYDDEGRLASRTDRRGFTFYWEYDRSGRCVRSVGDGGLLSVTLAYAPLEGRTTVIDANGGAWTYQYLPDGSITAVIDPYGAARRFDVRTGTLVAEYDEAGGRTEYRFDEAGAPIAKITPGGDAVLLPAANVAGPRSHRLPRTPAAWELGDFAAPDSRLPRPDELVSRVPAHVHAQLTTSADPLGGAARQVRDVQGLLFREEIEDGDARSYGYTPDGGIRRVTDHDGSVWRLEHTSWNHVAREIDPLGHAAHYEYSLTEKVTAAIDAAGVRTDYAYDLRDRLVEVKRGGAARESYTYDAAGNVTETRDAGDAVRQTMAYDLNGRLLTRTLASGETHTFEYDAQGRYLVARTRSHVCTFAHDRAGRRLIDKRDGLGVEHRFDRDGLAATVVLERFRIEYRRDTHGGLTVIDPTGAAHRLVSHGAGVYTRELADGMSETVQFHPRTERVLCKTLWSQRRPSMSWTRRYEYSGHGDLLAAHDSVRGARRYRYDAAHRLVESIDEHGGVAAYAYTPSGTLYVAPGLRAEPGELNRLAEANGDRLDYDDRHHLSARRNASGEWRYERDSRDQLIAAEFTGGRGERVDWRADYDPFARRIATRSARGETTYYWDTDRLAAEVFANGHVRIYVYADLGAMTPLLYVEYTSVDAPPESGVRRYVLSDQRGCPERVLDETGAVVWQARVDPYGRAEIEVGADVHQPLRFPGHFHDAETGLHYNRFRYYDPGLCRYLESDPIGLGGGLNVYAYTDNPLVDVDLVGLNCASSIHIREEADGSRTILEIQPVPGTGPNHQPRITEHWHRPGSRTVILGGEKVSDHFYRGGIVVEEFDRKLPSGRVVPMSLVSNDADLIRVANHYGNERGGLTNFRKDNSENWRTSKETNQDQMRIETQPVGHPRKPHERDWDGEGPHVAILRPPPGETDGTNGWVHTDKYFIRGREDYKDGKNRLHDPDNVFTHDGPTPKPEPEPK